VLQAQKQEWISHDQQRYSAPAVVMAEQGAGAGADE